MRKTNILWIGLAAPDSVYNSLLKRGYFHFAAQAAQKNFIEGIAECTDIPIDEISGFMMPSFFKTNELLMKSYSWETVNGGKGISVSNINIPYLDVVVRTCQIKKACIKWAEEHKDEKNIVIVYSAINAYLQGAMKIKKICNDTQVYLIITDLPQFMELRPSKIKKVLKDLNWKTLSMAIKSCDGWIPFTKHMIPYLNLPEEKCLVIEGSVNLNGVKSIANEKQQGKIIVMYSGSLGLQYGVPELLQAFSQIKDDRYELWFTGKGNAENLIEEYANMDHRIVNYGFLPSREELLKLQNKASMLINTRMPSEKASAYCFPSKLFDYMLTGKPVLSFKIQGIPDEYYKYLVVMESTDIKDIKNAILHVGEMTEDERNQIGKNARDYIINEKNNVKQCKKICEFIGLSIEKSEKL